MRRLPRYPVLLSTFTSACAICAVFILLLACSHQDTSAGSAKLRALAPVIELSAESQIVINEIVPLTNENEPQWIELFVNTAPVFLPLVTGGAAEAQANTVPARTNQTDSAIVGGWQIGDGDGNVYTFPAALPALPPSTYVVLFLDGLGEAADDYDAGDGVVELHTPPGLVNFLDAVDQLSLYKSNVQTTTSLVDFVAYGDFPLADADQAIAAGEWLADSFAAPTTQIPGGDVLTRGGSIGRYPLQDGNSPEDWGSTNQVNRRSVRPIGRRRPIFAPPSMARSPSPGMSRLAGLTFQTPRLSLPGGR